ncbi:MAG: hypothetical protein NC225_04255 [Clostridium sp.]|nr:hypothetical protein [Clostridium sp.]MCM1398679.1 hypothetical protein [Clostridium sp.]MCM1458690.1 hypothetical protein [Bacteroides sp.]
MKKYLVLCCIFILALFTVGCEKTTDLTDEESKMIAEYAGHLLLKYDRNTNFKYDESETTAASLDVTAREDETATGSDAENDVTTEKATTTETVDATAGDGVIIQVGEEQNVSGVVADESSSFDIATFLGEDNIAIGYEYYMLLDTYPSYDQDGVYIEIEAPKDYKLLVLKFSIENKTNEHQDIDLYSKDVKYNIIVNDAKSARQMLTLLMDDLYTYQKGIDGSVREEAVLLYQISDDVVDNISDLKLKISYNGSEKVMQLQ